MTTFLVLVGLTVWLGLAIAICRGLDAWRDRNYGYWSEDATERTRKQAVVVGRAGIVHVKKGWL